MKLYKDCEIKRQNDSLEKNRKKRNLKEEDFKKISNIDALCLSIFLLIRIENNNISNINIDTKLRNIECILNLINIYEIIFITLYVCKTILLTYRMFFKIEIFSTFKDKIKEKEQQIKLLFHLNQTIPSILNPIIKILQIIF